MVKAGYTHSALKSEKRPTSPWIMTKMKKKTMSLLASSAEQVLFSAHTNKCENRQTSPWLQTKMKVSYRNQNRHFIWEIFGFFSLSDESWHALYKKTVLNYPIQWQTSDMQCTKMRLSCLTWYKSHLAHRADAVGWTGSIAHSPCPQNSSASVIQNNDRHLY